MEVNHTFAYITCACGGEFQVLNEEQTDWDEAATAEIYYAHLADCPFYTS